MERGGKVYLVTLAFAANDILRRHAEVVKVERAGRRRADTKFLLLLHDLNAHVLRRDKTGDALVPLARVNLQIQSVGWDDILHV